MRQRGARARRLVRALFIVVAAVALDACADGDAQPRASGATLVAGPVVPATTEPAAPATSVPAAPAPTAPTPSPISADDAEAARAAWLAGPLTGRDNRMARHREARITTRADGTYEVYVKNQFAFRCTLSFGADGRPVLFERCRSGEPGWRASPASIPVTCTASATEEICEGPFRLLYPSSGGSQAALRIVRPLTR